MALYPDSEIYDLLIVGGGINGTGIAADAAGRGLKVLICEKGDLGAATSSASTKLIHGGLRYLEQYEFGLVRKALAEREILLRKAPHIIWPMRFLLPHRKHLRPKWMIRSGLYLYDSLAQGLTLPRSRQLKFAEAFGDDCPLVPELKHGFEYSDAWVDDARLVVLNAMQAHDLGATVLTRTRCVGAQTVDGEWLVTLRDEGQASHEGGSAGQAGEEVHIKARALVNASGPWVDRFARQAIQGLKVQPLRLVKGCHIVVPRLYPQAQAFLLQHKDGRVVFVIPYEQDYSLIGTTEVEYKGDPGQVDISDQEIDYLVAVVTEHFRRQISRQDVCHHFAGVRPLVGEDGEASASQVSRDYLLALDTRLAPVLTVYGGKITTYRKLAEAAMGQLAPLFPTMKPAWTRDQPLPGGDFNDRQVLVNMLLEAHPWLDESLVRRWARQYGTLAHAIIGQASCMADLGEDFGHGLHRAEVDYLQGREWARTAEDILWRRTKLGLRFNADQVRALQDYLATAVGAPG